MAKETKTKKFEAIGGQILFFSAEKWAGLVSLMLEAIENPELKFFNRDAAAMIKAGMMEKLKEEGDEVAIKTAEDIIAKSKE